MDVLDRTFHAVLFDMDGTLIDSTAAVEAAWTRWAARVGIPAAELLAYVHGRPPAQTIARFAGARDHAEERAWIHAADMEERGSIAAISGAAALLATLTTFPRAQLAADAVIGDFTELRRLTRGVQP